MSESDSTPATAAGLQTPDGGAELRAHTSPSGPTAGTPCLLHGQPMYHTVPGNCQSVSLVPVVATYAPVKCPDCGVWWRTPSHACIGVKP